MSLIKRALTALRAVWKASPAGVIAAASAAVVFTATSLGVVVNRESVASAVALVLPIILGGAATHHATGPKA